MSYTLYAVRVFSHEWDATTAFYETTVELPCKFKNAEMGWAEFELGSAALAVERMAADDPEAGDLVGRFVGISLEVPDILATYDSLMAKGVDFTGPPVKQPWGGTLAHFKDPDGNVITLLGAS